MSLPTVLMVIAAVVLNTAAQFILKAGSMRLAAASGRGVLHALLSAAQEPCILWGLTIYVISFGLWVAVLARMDISVAYPMLSLGYVLAAVVAYFWLGEPITTNKVIGIALIVAGVVVLARDVS